MTEGKKNQKQAGFEVKTFPVPFTLEEIKKNISLSTSKPSKEEIINRAFKCHLQGNISKAAEYYQHFINQGFKDYRVFSNYGIILKDLGKLKEAELSTRKAIELKPNYAEAHYNLGIILKDLDNLKEAESYIRQAIEIKANFSEAHSNLGIILKDLGKLKEAEISQRKAIEIKPNFAEAHSNLGIILKDLGKLKEAEISQRKAIELKPNFAEAYSILGSILKDLGKLKEAEISQRKAIEIKPNFAEAHYNLGNTFYDLGKLQDAELSYMKAIKIDPRYEDAKYNLSLCLLKSNNFKEGLIRYESRWKVKDLSFNIGNRLETNKPEWNLNKRGRVLLWAEQGIGDEILFSSLIPELIKLVDQLKVKVDKRLIPLFKRSFDKRIIYIHNDNILEEEDYDYQIAMGSLIKYLRTDKESFKKGKKKYLKADEIKTNIYKDKLIHNSKYKRIIGISWRSSNSKRNQSISLEKLILGIYSPNICFLNLQYGDTKEEINTIKIKYNINIFELKEVDIFNNLDDLASLVNACDMVVSIENTTFALAGGLGIDSKILLKQNCLWFNGHNDRKSYWLPNQTFYRQTSLGEWGKELNQIKNEIENFN
ncbi:tetratricopeptide repeat protein [Prochlorococcus marinus]|uniref:tetratricopeptide repeat protein n=1 Tax=Prochlorococcus marinus TaxID=1219 RepID=UPI0022B55E3D|nr:tetratricopeptide repeat protein [Prochlorococcus marinus]